MLLLIQILPLPKKKKKPSRDVIPRAPPAISAGGERDGNRQAKEKRHS